MHFSRIDGELTVNSTFVKGGLTNLCPNETQFGICFVYQTQPGADLKGGTVTARGGSHGNDSGP